jgi:hypothetical protein
LNWNEKNILIIGSGKRYGCIGIRFPIHIYEQLFETSGFSHRILVMGIKEQTEAIDVLAGYYAASVKYGTTIYYWTCSPTRLVVAQVLAKCGAFCVFKRKLFGD